jgi:hypothetical protein
MRRLVSTLVVVASALVLSACSGMRLVDSQVSAASTLSDTSVLKGARYRFEQTPLQTPQQTQPPTLLPAPQAAQATPLRQSAALYDLAEQALGEAGLVRDDANAAYTFIIGVRVTPYLVDSTGRPYNGLYPYGGFSTVWGLGGWRSSGYGWGIGGRFPPATHYRHELSLLMRDVRSGALVYETQAMHDGPWNDTHNILAAMFKAALKDFPEQGRGTRRVDIEIAR